MLEAMGIALIDKIKREYGGVYVPVFRDDETLSEYIVKVWTQAAELFDNPNSIRERTAARMIAILNSHN